MGFLEKMLEIGLDILDWYQMSQVYPTLRDASHQYHGSDEYTLMECTPFSAKFTKYGVLGGDKTVTLTVQDDGSVYIVESGFFGDKTVFPKTAGAPTPEQFAQMILEKEAQNQASRELNESPDLQEYYEVLGCDPGVSDAELTKCYRDLSRQYHPDRISSKDLAPDFIEFAKKKFQEIQNAYDNILKHRKS